MKHLSGIISFFIIAISCYASDFWYNYDAELEVGIKYRGAIGNCLYHEFISPIYRDMSIKTAIVYKDGGEYIVGVDDNHKISLLECRDKSVVICGYKIGDIMDMDSVKRSMPNKVINYRRNIIFIELGNGWNACILQNNTIATFYKQISLHTQNLNNYNSSEFYYNYAPDLELNSYYQGDLNNCDSIILPFSNQKVRKRTIYKDGIRYNIGVDDKGEIILITCDQNDVKIGNYLNGRIFDYLSKPAKFAVGYRQFYVYIDDGWWIEVDYNSPDCSSLMIKYNGWDDMPSIIQSHE